jgi:hypothetical protein
MATHSGSDLPVSRFRLACIEAKYFCWRSVRLGSAMVPRLPLVC